MIEFAAGIMLGGSIGAVIMGALLAQTRDTVRVVLDAPGLATAAHAVAAPRWRLTRLPVSSPLHRVPQPLPIADVPAATVRPRWH